MEPRRALETAIEQTRPIVAAISPEQYQLPTPCTDWDVRALLNHLLGALIMWEGLPRGEGDPTALGGDHVGDDAGAAYDELAGTARSAWMAEGVIEGVVAFPGRELPGAFAARMLAGDVLVHGWDLARATGQSVSWDQELAADIIEWQEEADATFPPELRARAFSPEVPLPPGADAMTRLVALVGRQP